MFKVGALVAYKGKPAKISAVTTHKYDLSFSDGSSRKVFVSVYDNTQLEVYAIQSGSGLSDWNPKTIGTILNPNDTGQHPMLPSIVISDITEDTGKEILVPQPPATDNGDAQLWLFTDEGDYADGWSSSYVLDGGGEIDATPAVGDIDGDGENEIVAVTWEDPSDLGNNEITHVWAVSHDATLEWETEYDTDSSGGWDNDEHAISSPILAATINKPGLPICFGSIMTVAVISSESYGVNNS